MIIEWNKVTWYSKVLAIILFVLTFYVGFVLGEKSAEIGIISKMPQDQLTTKGASVPISIVNKDIKEENFSGKYSVVSGSSILAGSARTYIENQVNEFRVQANKDVPDMRKQFGIDSPPATYEIDIKADYVKGDKTESIVISVYAYTGGANGNSIYKVITSSLGNGKILSLSDIVKKDKQTAFTELVKKELNNWRPEGSTASVVFPEEVNKLNFDSFKNWSLDSKNLTIYFSKYDIGPGVLGPVAFPISVDKIKDF